MQERWSGIRGGSTKSSDAPPTETHKAGVAQCTWRAWAAREARGTGLWAGALSQEHAARAAGKRPAGGCGAQLRTKGGRCPEQPPAGCKRHRECGRAEWREVQGCARAGWARCKTLGGGDGGGGWRAGRGIVRGCRGSERKVAWKNRSARNRQPIDRVGRVYGASPEG